MLQCEFVLRIYWVLNITTNKGGLSSVVECSWSCRCDCANGTKVHALEHFLGLGIDLDALVARREGGELWDIVVSSLSLLQGGEAGAKKEDV